MALELARMLALFLPFCKAAATHGTLLAKGVEAAQL
jgi:hypothetical protein